MTKLEVQQRVLKNGVPLALKLFTWDEATRTFSSKEDNLVLDFNGIDGCTFTTGYNCTFDTGSYCTFDTGSYCTFKTGSYCTFTTGYNCTFKTGSNCTFKTGSDCTFTTGSDCTFTTGYNCTFDTGSYCTFKTGYGCVIVRRDEFEVIQPLENETIQLCPSGIEGFLANGYLNRDKSLGEHIIVDGILSKVVSKKQNVYKVINHGDTKVSYIIKQDDVYSHGSTLKEAKDSLIYKISNRDKSQYENLKLDSVISKEEAIKMYRVVTGACEAGTRGFVEKQTLKETYTVQEIIDLTVGQFGNSELVEFMKGR